MAVVAGIGCAKLYGDVRTRNAKTVIVPCIDDHVGAARHVTRRAGERWGYRLMSMVLRIRVLFLGVTLQAGAVRFEPQPGAMWVVTIAAGDAGRKHSALLERTVIVGLFPIQHLSVGVIKAAANRRNHVSVG